MKRWSIVLLVVFSLILSFGACSNPAASSSPDDSDPSVPAGSSRILFSYVDSLSSISHSLSTIESDADLYWYNLYNGEYGYQALQSGDNSVDLSKNGIYVLSIVKKNQPGIISQGFIGISNIGLESIPIAANAEEIIDLGVIDPVSYDSSVGSARIAGLLGYTLELLTSLRGFDITFKKFLNPDINRNNVYDNEEGIKWRISGTSARHLSTSLYNLSTANMILAPNDLKDFQFTYVFNAFSNIPVTMITSAVTLILPDDVMVMTNSGQILEMTNPRYNGPEIMPGHYPQYYFSAGENDIISPALPINGNFKLNIDGTEYHLDNLEFTRPEDDYEGYIFPLFEYTRNAVGAYKEIRWSWKTIQNGQIENASPDEIRIKATQIQIYLGEPPTNYSPETFGLDYWQNGIINVEHYGAIRSDQEEYTENNLRTSYWDRAGNNYAYRFYNDSYPINEIVSVRTLVSVEALYDEILGVWGNDSLYAVNDVPGRILLYKNGTAVSYNSAYTEDDDSAFTYTVEGIEEDNIGSEPDLIRVMLLDEAGNSRAVLLRRVNVDGQTVLEVSFGTGSEYPSFFNQGSAPHTYALIKEVIR